MVVGIGFGVRVICCSVSVRVKLTRLGLGRGKISLLETDSRMPPSLTLNPKPFCCIYLHNSLPVSQNSLLKLCHTLSVLASSAASALIPSVPILIGLHLGLGLALGLACVMCMYTNIGVHLVMATVNVRVEYL